MSVGLVKRGADPVNDSPAQFIAVCPNCAAVLRVNVNKLGQNIRCSQCHHTFVGGEALESAAQQSATHVAPLSNQANENVERIDAVCPGCNATLHVRRAYIGNEVRCKYCEGVFTVKAPGEEPRKAAHTDDEAHRNPLQAEHERLYVEHNLLKTDHERVKAECDELRASFRRVAAELETIRLALGSIAPEEVGPLASERHSLSEEVHRLRDEVHALVADRAERDRLISERLDWESERDISRVERDRLVDQLRDRDDELAAVRAENDGLKEAHRAEPGERDAPDLSVDSDESVADVARSQTAGRMIEETSTAEIDELRAQLADAIQRLERAEDLNREMAGTLRGMGLRFEPTWA
jgi:predicted Zn finger-like uncharacterized protein